MPESNLNKFRKKIDQDDTRMLQAISDHLSLALQIEKEKRKNGEEILSPKRKREKLSQLVEIGKELNPPLDSKLVKKLWELLHDYFVQEQTKQRKKG